MADDATVCCVACFGPTDERLAPCAHPMCAACAARWVAEHGTCPSCRRDTCGLLRAATHQEPGRVVRVAIPRYAHAGITLARATHGVRVEAVHPYDRAAASGLRRGMVLETLNGVPCARHDVVARMFNAARGGDVVLTVRGADGALSRCVESCLPREG